MDASLIVICCIAFAIVFLVLAFLAVAMHLIAILFPVPKTAMDPMVVAAIASAVTSQYPGARVTRIEVVS
ncbi:MAG: hypothetical protein AB1726_00915 [Planctomycetota bacterium]